MNFIKMHGKTLLLAAALAVWAVCLSGCSGKKNPVNPSGGNVVCEDGEAWIEDGTDGGFIFTPDGEIIAVAMISDGRWYGAAVGTYSTGGNKLTMVLSVETDTVTYKVSGDKLTLTGEGDPIVFTKRTGLNVNM